jgi:hypothetical protein
MRIAVALLTLLALAGPAAADDELDADPKSHKGQGMVNLQLGTGYRAIFTYDQEFCGDIAEDGENSTNCTGRKPLLLGIVLGYGVLDSLEAIVELGVGLEGDFGDRADPDDGPRQIVVAPGIKAYLAELGPMQLFSSMQFAIDFTDYAEPDGVDYAVRNINGLQFDVHRTLGLYFYFGEQVGFRNWLSFTVEAGAGIQARFP